MTAHSTDFIQKIRTAEAISQIGGRAVPAPDGAYRAGLKRMLDIAFVLAALPIILPTILVLMLLVARDGHSPIYRQKRIGRGGAIFTMWKLRTMVPDAQALLEGYLASNDIARAEWTKTQKLRNDPRITPLGRFLRKSSLDELPQLWNVLKGEMSIVGPRPMLPEQQAMYPGSCYYALRPGITGLWQVSERNKSSFADRARYDSSYNYTLSLVADMRIIWQTFAVVMRGTGC